MPSFARVSCAAVLGTAILLAGAPWDDHGRLEVSPNRRYLQHRDGTPFLWIGDTAWALFYKARREEVRAYLDDRQRKGFNVIQAVAFWYPHGEDGPGPTNAANAYGHRPFHGDDDAPSTSTPLTVDGGGPDEPNDYWDNADFIVREVRRRGMYLALLPCWGRALINASQEKSHTVFTQDDAREYGRFLGRRFAAEPHIVWVIGGDINPTRGEQDQRVVYRAMAEGIGQGATGAGLRWDRQDPKWDEVLMTYHPDGDWKLNSSEWFHGDAWLDANGIETWKWVDHVYEAVSHDHGLAGPVKPTLFLEGAYEGGNYQPPGGPISALKVRRQFCQSFLAGASGHTYGASSMWHFKRKPPTWEEALRLPGAAQAGTVLRRFLNEQRWWSLVPDQSLIVEGAGEGETRKVSARSDDGRRVVVYFPDASQAQVNLAVSGKAVAAWFSPASGETQAAGEHAAGRPVTFTPPAGWEDALLVIETGP